MPRRNRRAAAPGAVRPAGSLQSVQHHPDGEWHVRAITGDSSTKVYRCPGCQQEIRPGLAHVVAWPAGRHDGADERRHWHTPCWSTRLRNRSR